MPDRRSIDRSTPESPIDTPSDEPRPLEVGDEGVLVYNQRYHGPRKAKVIKVGRRWATLDLHGTRVDRHTFLIDGGNYMSPGQFYTPEAMRHRERMERADPGDQS